MSTNETHVKVRATIGVNDLVGSYKASAKFMNFGVVDLGRTNAVVDGDLNILDWVINKVNNFVINLVKDFVVVALEIPLKKLVQNVLDTAELPDLTATRF